MASLLYALLPAVFLAIALTPEVAGDPDPNLVVHSVKRTTTYYGVRNFTVYTFDIKFTATVEPWVKWMSGPLLKTKLTFGSLSYNDTTGEGSASLILLDGFRLLVQIGQPKQWFTFLLNTDYSHSEKFHELNLQFSAVSPAMDASYKSGVNTVPTQTITVNKVMGTDVTLLPNSLMYYGNHLIGNTGSVFLNFPHPKQRNAIVQTDATDVNTTVFSFNSLPGVDELSGYFKGFVYGVNTAVDSPIEKYVFESFALSVHDDSDKGPFPDGKVFVQFLGEKKTCRAGRFCSILCDARGNEVGNITIFKVYENGTTSEILSTTLTVDSYWKYAKVYLPINEDRSGQYKCEGTGATADVTDDGLITVTDMGPVEVESLTLDADTNIVTCDVRGQAIKPLMTVFGCLSHEQLTYDITWAANTIENDEGSQLASVNLTASSEGCEYVRCSVSNAVSFDYRFVNVFL